MRDPARIDPLLEKLGEAWKKYPDMRFGQFVDNFFSVCEQNTFNMEDDVWEVALDAFIRGERPTAAIKNYIETQRTK